MTGSAVSASSRHLLDHARRVLLAEQRILALLIDGLDEALPRAAECVASGKGRVLASGMGKSGIAARKLAATLCSLGVPAQFLHAADALHGDMGAVAEGDVLVAISVSGETRELIPLVEYAGRIGAATVAITARTDSPLSQGCDHLLLLPACEEGGELAAPMAATIASIAMGDALAALAAACRGTARGDMAAIHPAGEIGRQLRPVSQVMHGGDRLPLVRAEADAVSFVAEITAKGFGIAGVTDTDGILIGTISDGDVRRHLETLDRASAGDVMVAHPVTLPRDGDVGQAMDLMRTHRISTVFVVDGERGRVEGLVHLQDLLRIGIL